LRSLTFFTANRPFGPVAHGYDFASSGALALIDTDANGGPSVTSVGEDDSARSRGELSTPAAIGTTMTAMPAVASRIFLQPFNVAPGSFFMICSILFLRSEPVTPDTHTSGDST
jgi:hypothetical protein